MAEAQRQEQYGGEMGASQVYFVLERAGLNIGGRKGEELLRKYGAREVRIEEGWPEREGKGVIMMGVADVKRLLEDLRTGKLRVQQDSGLAQRTP